MFRPFKVSLSHKVPLRSYSTSRNYKIQKLSPRSIKELKIGDIILNEKTFRHYRIKEFIYEQSEEWNHIRLVEANEESMSEIWSIDEWTSSNTFIIVDNEN